MIRAVVFDLDGLLVDSEPVWFRVRTEMFGRFGLTWTDDDQKALMGRSTQAWIDYVFEKLGGRLSHISVKNETLASMVEEYRAGRVSLTPGAEEALSFCAAHFVTGLASGSPRLLIHAALDANRWHKKFREVLSSDEVLSGKPAPDAYLEVLKRLGVPPSDAVVVEDSGSGILAGKASGTRVVAVPNPALMPSADALRSADIVLDSLHALPSYLTTVSQSGGRSQ